jgi:outer membrane biosynthesis protein TonB
MKKLLLIAVLLLVAGAVKAQTHTYKPGCRYFIPTPGPHQASSLEQCPACAKEDQEKIKAQQAAEDKRIADQKIATAKWLAEKLAKEKAAKAKAIAEEANKPKLQYALPKSDDQSQSEVRKSEAEKEADAQKKNKTASEQQAEADKKEAEAKKNSSSEENKSTTSDKQSLGTSGGGSTGSKSSSTQKSGSSNGSASAPSTTTHFTDYQLNLYNAGIYELGGDNYYKQGPLFYSTALLYYQKAQGVAYTQRVQQKIDNVNGILALPQALDKVSQQIEDAVDKLDPHEATAFTIGSINYEGLSGNYSKITNAYQQNPYSTFLAVTAQRIFLTFEVRFEYTQSPVYEFNVEMHYSDNKKLVDKIALQQQSIGLGLSGGLNIPLKRLVFYGIYGFDSMLYTVGKTIKSNGSYTLNDDTSPFPLINLKLSVGMDIIIPKTSVGLGIRYNINSISGTTDLSDPINNTKDSNTSNYYYITSTVQDSYKFNNLGVRFFWLLK